MSERQPSNQQPDFSVLKKRSQESILQELNSIGSLQELEAALGPLLPEEQELCEAVRQDIPSSKDFEAIDDDRADKVAARALERIKRGPSPMVNPETGEPETYLQRRTRWTGENIQRFEDALEHADDRYQDRSSEEMVKIKQELESNLASLRTEDRLISLLLSNAESSGINQLSPKEIELVIKSKLKENIQ